MEYLYQYWDNLIFTNNTKPFIRGEYPGGSSRPQKGREGKRRVPDGDLIFWVGLL
jgi:hypothetical protein